MEYEYFSLDTPVTLPKIVSKYRYELLDLKPHVSVCYQVWCFTAGGEFVQFFSGMISGEEYEAWSHDDTYMDNLIKAKVEAQLAVLA